MSFPVRLSFRSGFVLDAIPGWEDAMLLPLDEKLALFEDREALAHLNELASSETNPLRSLAHWENLKIYDVSRPRTSSTAVARSARSPPTRAATRGRCSPTSPAPTS